MASSDTLFSYSNFSEEFSQSQDTAELWDPSDEAFAREGEALQRELHAAAAAMESARRGKSQAALDSAERVYEDLATRWVGFQETLKDVIHVKPGYISLASALNEDLLTGQELSPDEQRTRWETLIVLIDYVMQSGMGNLGGAFKNFLAMVRRIKPEAMDGISQTDLAAILGETKATTSAREKARVEEVARKAGVKGWHFLGGTKPEETRKRSADAAKGNTNRRDGSRKKRL